MTSGTRRGWGVSATPRLLFTPGKDPVPIVQEAGWAPKPVWTGAENLAPTGIRSPDCPARSQLLYQLRYPAHSFYRKQIFIVRQFVGEMCKLFTNELLVQLEFYKADINLQYILLKFLSSFWGYSECFDVPWIKCIRKKTGAQNIVKEIKQDQEKWLQHIQRMDTNSIPKQALQYKPKDEDT